MSKNNSQNNSNINSTEISSRNSKIFAVIFSLITIAGVVAVPLFVLPNIISQTDEQVAIKEENDKILKEKQFTAGINQKIVDENTKFGFGTTLVDNKPSDKWGAVGLRKWNIKMQSNFGELPIELDGNAAPKTVENFVRLVSRGYFDNLSFHRITKNPKFAVIQGGDKEKQNGTGGQSAFYVTAKDPNPLADEVYKVKPELEQKDGQATGKILNQPEFTSSVWYKDFDKTTGGVTYPKGTIIMAKAGPDTAGSQFFITLADTTLPAQYAAFGSLAPSSYAVLDKIYNEVEPIAKAGASDEGAEQSSPNDGVPNKDIVITKVGIEG